MARLLSVGLDIKHTKSEANLEQETADFLHNLLAVSLPPDEPQVKSLSGILSRLCWKEGLQGGKTIGEILRNPKTNISLIKKVKEYGKKLVRSTKSKGEHNAAIAIYYAAIAEALVFWDIRITKFPYRSLERYFSLLLKKEWILPEFVGLFVKARQYCRNKM